MIEIRGVSKQYNGLNRQPMVSALHDLSLDVAPGEFVSILGPSGCGKTTLLKVIGGLELATSGTVSVDGRNPSEARQGRMFGFVFQHPVLFEWRTVRENVCLPGEVFGDAEVIRRAEDCIGLVGLCGFEEAYPNQLSGGMQSRVAIARALSFRPDILLMDEPFGDLDEMTRTRMNVELLRIWDNTKATVVFITHSITEAVFLSDRVVLLSDRPARVDAVLDVKLPRPRVLDMVESPEFLRLARDLRGWMGLRG